MPSSTASKDNTNNMCPWLKQIKPWNGLGIYVEHLAQHYALMAMNPATIDHARYMSKALKSDFPTLATLIVEKLRELRNETN
jgi:hypothetical protein